MEGKIIDRIFTELDNHTKSLVDLSKIVHANAAILGLVTKLVVAIILFIVTISLGTLYNYFKPQSQILYHRQIAPIESNLYDIDGTGRNPNDKGGM